MHFGWTVGAAVPLLACHAFMLSNAREEEQYALESPTHLHSQSDSLLQLARDTEPKKPAGLDESEKADFYPLQDYSTSWDDHPSTWGEPLNVIISGHSHPSLASREGLLAYVKKLGFEPECLNLHFGDLQHADLNDGRHYQKQLFEIRQAYFPIFGTCLQSAVGGNHFRAWQQTGRNATSNAWFLAVSLEYDYRRNHMIRSDGYDRGRDAFVRAAHKEARAGQEVTVSYLDLIEPGKPFNHGIETDGRVAVILVRSF